MFLENSPIISTLISRFRLHAMHVDVSTINHKFDQRVPSFSSSFYFSPPLKESFSKETVRERERERGEVIRCATVASDTLSDKEGFSKRDEVSRSRLRRLGGGGEREGEGGAQKTAQRRVEQFYGEVFALCTVENPGKRSLSAGRFSLPRRELYSKTNSPCDLRAYVSVYKKGEKLLGVCTVCLLLIYYRGSPSSDYPINSGKC